MPETSLISVKQLSLDLNNYRTLPQKNELNAIHAMISVNPDRFWALTESLLTDGYHPTENIIVLKNGKNGKVMLVKEGNRRIAALKLILGYISRTHLTIPSHIDTKINKLPKNWKEENQSIPCAIYGKDESGIVDKIVSLTHGKGEKAGRDKWNAVARARHNRDKNCASEPALDLLEKYLSNGKNLTAQQKERWGGEYPLSVLDEATKRLATRFGAKSSRELSINYPLKIKYWAELENILRDIGLEIIDFQTIRNQNEDYAFLGYGIPDLQMSGTSSQGSESGVSANPINSSPDSSDKAEPKGRGTGSSKPKSKAQSMDDPRTVMRALRKFTPRGNNREKLATLLKEARQLKLKDHPHAFCFLLRSMFEVSANAYCKDHSTTDGPKHTKSDGTERKLVEVLSDISKHLSGNGKNKQMIKTLHGAMTELGKPSGILSVTSMNQLVHNPRFSIKEDDISALFGNIFPLLEEMNR